MTVQQLQYVLEVHKAGSITQAAKNLFVAPPSVSNAIRALEEELGYPIFVRGRQGAVLTPKGAWVVKHARQVWEHMRQIEEGEPVQTVPPFRLETGQYLPATKAFTRLVKEYQSAPERLFQHRVSNVRSESLDHLVAGTADLVVLFMPEGSMSKFDYFVNKRHLFQQRLATIPGIVRLGKGHRLYDVPEFDLNELKKEYLVDSPGRPIAESHLIQSKVPFDPFRLRLQENWLGRYELVQEGAGFQIGIKLPDYLDREYGFRSVPMPGFVFHAVAITNPSVPLREEAKRYLELLGEELALV